MVIYDMENTCNVRRDVAPKDASAAFAPIEARARFNLWIGARLLSNVSFVIDPRLSFLDEIWLK